MLNYLTWENIYNVEYNIQYCSESHVAEKSALQALIHEVHFFKRLQLQ